MYATLSITQNVARIQFDPQSATVKGAVEPLTTGPRDFGPLDVSPNGQELVLAQSSGQREDLYVLPVWAARVAPAHE